MIGLSKFNICDLLIGILIIGVLLSNYIWLKIDESPPWGHELSGVIPAVQVYRELKGMENPYKLYDKILGKYNPLIPPLSFLLVALFYLLFGLQGQMVLMVNSLYIALTLITVYLIGKHIFNTPTGLLAAFILSSFPGFIAFSRQYWIEFGLMAYVSLDLLFLLKTNFFENRKYSILLGISLALSFLHKYEFIFFIIGPLLLVIYKSGILKDILRLKWSSKLTNIILILILAIGLTSFWWVPYGKDIMRRTALVSLHIDDQIQNKISSLQSILSFESLTYYLYSIKNFLGIIFLLFLFISIIFLLVRIKQEKKKFYVLYFFLSIIVSFIVLSLLATKTFSHILPILPSMAILICASIYFIKFRLFKIALVSLIVLYCLNLHLHSFYPIKILIDFNYYTAGLRSPPLHYFLATCNLPRQGQLERGIKEILEYIKVNSNARTQHVFVAYKNIEFAGSIFEYYSLIGNFQTRFFSPNRTISEFSECDYIIIEKSEGELMAEIFSRIYKPFIANVMFKKIFQDGLKDFDLIKIYKIPNRNTEALIYRRANPNQGR